MEDSPWFTICLNPSTNITKMIEYLCGQPPLFDDLEHHKQMMEAGVQEYDDYHCHHELLAGELTLDELRILAAHNVSASAALKDLVRPLVERFLSCSRGGHARMTCSFPPPAPPLPPNSEQRRRRSFYSDQSEVTSHFLNTPDGVWESRIYWGRSYKEVKLCSTLKPKAIMGPGPRNKYRMAFTLHKHVDFNMDSQA